MTSVLITRSPDLRDEVCRLAAAAGVEPMVLTEPVGALVEWPNAQVVLVGVDVGAEVSAVQPARRSGVHLVGFEPGDEAFRTAVALGAESVVDLARGGAWLGQLLADVDEPDGGGRLVAVVGGAGGVGATTLACALAQAGAAHGSTLLVDVDPWGPGIDRLVGLDEVPGTRWPDLHGTTGRLGARALREAVPRREGLGVLTWTATGRHLAPETVRQALAAARRGHDLVVLDLPRRVDALAAELASRCDAVVVVCRRDIAGIAAAARVVEDLRIRAATAGLVLRPGPVPAADAEDVLGLPVLAELADQRGVGAALDLGLGPLAGRRGPLARAARRLVSTGIGAA